MYCTTVFDENKNKPIKNARTIIARFVCPRAFVVDAFLLSAEHTETTCVCGCVYNAQTIIL